MTRRLRNLSLALGLSLAGLAGCTPPQLSGAPPQPAADPAVRVEQGSVTSPGEPSGWAHVQDPLPIGRASTAYAPDELLVALEGATDESALLDRLPGVRVLERVDGTRRMIRVAIAPGSTPQETSRALYGVPGVRYAALNRLYQPTYSFPSGMQDTHYASQWAHRPGHGDTEGAWNLLSALPGSGASQARVIVAVIDTGLDVGHPEFAGRLEAPRNFTATNSFDPDLGGYPAATASNVVDTSGHGTHVAGIVGAAGANARGVAGVAWGVRIMPLKVFGGRYANTFDILRAMYFAADYEAPDGARVRVVNMSLGTAGLFHTDVAMDEAIGYLAERGVVTVVAAGNESGPVTAPANSGRCLAVSSTSASLGYEFLSGFSNFGGRIDVAAPGGAIWSTVPRFNSSIGGTDASANPYRAISGTSMAAPYAAGVAALVIARYASESVPVTRTSSFAARVIGRLQRSADDLGEPGRDGYYGFGRVNARRAIEAATLD